jgi:hypothetical protein
VQVLRAKTLGSEALRGAEPRTTESILTAFTLLEGTMLWSGLGSLAEVCETIEFRAPFAAGFLSAVSRRVASDLGSGIFWNSVRVFCERQPSVALQTLRIVYDELDDTRMELATFLLGTLRRCPLQAIERDAFDRIESCFKDHDAGRFRTIFNQSWVSSANRAGLTVTELKDLIDRHAAGTIEERHDLLGVVCRSISMQTTANDSFQLGLQWIRANTDAALSSSARLSVLMLVESMWEKVDSGLAEADADASDLLRAIQPIPVSEGQTWMMVQRYLVKRLQFNVPSFNQLFVRFVEGDPVGLDQVFRTPRGFEWLLNEMRRRDTSDPISRIIMSGNKKCRRLGLLLFDELAIETVSSDLVNGVDEREVRLAFHEFQRTMMTHGESSARFLVSLLPRLPRMGEQF